MTQMYHRRDLRSISSSAKSNTMTIKDLLSFGTAELQSVALDDASRDAEYLLAHVLKTSREYLLAHPERALRGDDTAAYKTIVDRRRAGEPVSILTSTAWFYGLPFTVNEHVLAPRPETELLINHAHARYANERPATIVDVGTGSGCIAITLAATLENPPPLYAIDISPAALLVAEKNAIRHHRDHQINFLEGNLLDPLPRTVRTLPERKWIIGNLPYLPQALYAENPALRYEPKIALVGGDDGLDAIRGLLAMMEDLQSPWTLFMEIDPAIMTSLRDLLRYHFPQSTPEIICDLHGHERVCIIKS